MIEFRLHSEGSKKKPLWGLAFKHRVDVTKAIDFDKHPSQIDIKFPDGQIITFGIRPSFWKGCYEFVDAQVKDKCTGLSLKRMKPVKSIAVDKLKYDVKTKQKCVIMIQIIEKNRLLKIVKFI